MTKTRRVKRGDNGKYNINGKKFDYLPASVDDQFMAKPIYKSFKG